MILKQGTIYKCNAKAKWCDAWYIYSHDDYGPRFAIYKDSTAKKVEISISLHAVASEIRFGSTSHRTAGRPSSVTKDVRVHDSCFMSIPVERASKKSTTHETLWLCTTSVLELFDLVKLFSYSFTVMKDRAPACYHEEVDSVFSLHRYRPIAFIAETDWERFYDTPPQQTLFKQRDVSLINRSSSVDVIGEKITLRGLKSKLMKSERKKATKSLTVFSETSNHEYDEVPESCCERHEKGMHQVIINEEIDANHKSQGRSATTVLETSLDDLTFSDPAEVTHNEHEYQHSLTVDTGSLDEYSAICVKQREGDVPHHILKAYETNAHYNTGSTEVLYESGSPTKYTAKISNSLCTETFERLCRSRELNEKPIVAPKPSVPLSPPPSPSSMVFTSVIETSTSPDLYHVNAAHRNQETTPGMNSNEENHPKDDSVMTTISLTLKQTQRTTLLDPTISTLPAMTSFKISDLQVQSGGGLRAIASLPARRAAPVPITEIVDDFPMLKLHRNKECDEFDEMNWREREIEGFTAVNAQSPTNERSRMRCCSDDFNGPVSTFGSGVSKVIELSL